MTLLLNLLPLAIAGIGLVLALRLRKFWIVIATALALWVYFQAQPSYLPKGQIERAPVPALENTEATIQDRVPKPDSLDERDQRMKSNVQNGLDFKP